MTQGEIFTHVGNKANYMIVGKAKLKNNQTRKWEPAIIYMEVPVKKVGENTIYVRSEADFKRRFTQVHTPVHPA